MLVKVHVDIVDVVVWQTFTYLNLVTYKKLLMLFSAVVASVFGYVGGSDIFNLYPLI